MKWEKELRRFSTPVRREFSREREENEEQIGLRIFNKVSRKDIIY